jgi:hypothetical protein
MKEYKRDINENKDKIIEIMEDDAFDQIIKIQEKSL